MNKTTVLPNPEDTGLCGRKIKKYIQKTCRLKTMKKIIPITEWLPKYNISFFIQDAIAGLTVGLTAIPQGIAYAVVAGLRPEYGLYASLTAGIVYVIFGSCKDVTVGPTAILSTMTAKYVANYSSDFAILAAFLSGLVILAMGILRLGLLVEFISMPVINGFTTAAALQIAASQLKSLFGLSGASGNFFAESVYYFFDNITTAKLWEPILGFGTIIMLVLLKKMGQGCNRTDGFIKQARWFISLARNAVVVITGMIIAYILKVTLNAEPLALIGDIGSGLPEYRPPPFSTTFGNETYTFGDMMQVLGYQSIVLPLVSILESVAIAKAFAKGTQVDATQEMIALGLCNIIGSIGQSMPVTGSFTRTALNNISGVQTQAGGITNVLLIIIALTTLTSTFYYIPKASLAGLIITAMFSMIDYTIITRLWKNSKRELVIMLITMAVCLFVGLEYGIVVGIVIEAVLLLYNVSRPSVNVFDMKYEEGDLLVIQLSDSIAYCAAEHVRKEVLKLSFRALSEASIVIDGTNLKHIDFTVSSNLMSVVNDLQVRSKHILLLNFHLDLKNLCVSVEPKAEDKFVYATDAVETIETYTKHV